MFLIKNVSLLTEAQVFPSEDSLVGNESSINVAALLHPTARLQIVSDILSQCPGLKTDENIAEVLELVDEHMSDTALSYDFFKAVIQPPRFSHHVANDVLGVADHHRGTLDMIEGDEEDIVAGTYNYLADRGLARGRLIVSYEDANKDFDFQTRLAEYRSEFVRHFTLNNDSIKEAEQEFTLWLDEKVRSGDMSEAVAKTISCEGCLLSPHAKELEALKMAGGLAYGYGLVPTPVNEEVMNALTITAPKIHKLCRDYGLSKDDIATLSYQVGTNLAEQYRTSVDTKVSVESLALDIARRIIEILLTK